MNLTVTATPQERLLQAIYATLIATPITQEADALVAELSAKVCGRRKNRGRETEIKKAVGAFLSDLLRANESKRAEGFVYRSMKAETFTGQDVSYRTFKFVVESLVALGWLERPIKGKQFWTANGFDPSAPPYATGGHASRSG